MKEGQTQLQKNHSTTEPAKENQKVLGRRKYHEAAAVWCGRSLVPLQVFFALIGLFVILLPAIIKDYGAFVVEIPWLSRVFYDYSTFSGLALINLFLGMLTAITKPYWSKSRPSGNIPVFKGRPAPVACPVTYREEFSFWMEIFSLVLVATFWLYIPFGVIAYFLRMGG